MDPTLRATLVTILSGLAAEEALGAALARMWDDCLEHKAFGYSAHRQALEGALPELFRAARPLLADLPAVQRFCQAMPAILIWLPYDSDESPFGYTHTILPRSFEARARSSPDLAAFLGGFERRPPNVCRVCGADMAVQVHRRRGKLKGASYVMTCTCGATKIC